MSIPFHDDQKLPPEKRHSSFLERLGENAFYIERDDAFTIFMDVDKLIAFFTKYKIPYSNPRAEPRLYPSAVLRFYAMCYLTVLHTHVGSDTREEIEAQQGLHARATAWLYGHGCPSDWKSDRQTIRWNLTTADYIVNGVKFSLHPLLKKKRPQR